MVEQSKTLTVRPSDWLIAFGQRLERIRGQRGLTQSDLAGPELSKSFVSLLETARSYPSVETLLRMGRRLGTSVGHLVLETADLRLDTALSLIELARQAEWSRAAWAERLLNAAEDLVPDMPAAMRSEIQVIRAATAAAQDRLDVARRLARGAREQAAQAGAGAVEARALGMLGQVALMKRDNHAAFAALAEAVATFRRHSALRSEFGVAALMMLGTTAAKVGRQRYARRIFSHALKLSERLHLERQKGNALMGLGLIAWERGDLADAARALEDARRTFDQTEDLSHLSATLTNLGRLYGEQGHAERALQTLQQSANVKERLKDIRGLSATYHEMAGLYLRLRDLDRAQDAANQALGLAQRARDPQNKAYASSVLGRIAAARGDRSAAARLLTDAARGFKRLGMQDAWSEAARDLAMVKEGITEAEALLAQAVPASKPGRSRRTRATRSGTRSSRSG